jgi:hypothetical protein
MVQGITLPSALESQIEGQVIQPSDSHYEQLRLTWNRLIDQRPALIVVAANPADVSAAVRFARENDLPVAVQSTGHGVTVPADGALLLVTSQLKDLRIDAGAQTAWLGAGLQWGEVLEQTQAVGLAPLAGSSPTVSVTGYTLGGGYGWLGRKYGLAADSVLSFEMVDANGNVLQISEDHHSDLFWGLRGGGGSFGVITSMQVRLYPVTHVYAGNLLYPAEQARQVLQHYREWVVSAPDELTSSIALMNLPPLPEVPEFLRGKSIVMVRGCYAGDTPSGEKLLDHWRSWQAPMVDLWGEMPFTRMVEISMDPVEPMPSNHSGAFLKDLNDAAIDTLIQYAYPPGGPPPLVMVEARHFGGAVAHVGAWYECLQPSRRGLPVVCGDRCLYPRNVRSPDRPYGCHAERSGTGVNWGCLPELPGRPGRPPEGEGWFFGGNVPAFAGPQGPGGPGEPLPLRVSYSAHNTGLKIISITLIRVQLVSAEPFFVVHDMDLRDRIRLDSLDLMVYNLKPAFRIITRMSKYVF